MNIEVKNQNKSDNIPSVDNRFYNRLLPDLSVIPFHHKPGIYKIAQKVYNPVLQITQEYK